MEYTTFFSERAEAGTREVALHGPLHNDRAGTWETGYISVCYTTDPSLHSLILYCLLSGTQWEVVIQCEKRVKEYGKKGHQIKSNERMTRFSLHTTSRYIVLQRDSKAFHQKNMQAFHFLMLQI